MKRLLGVALAAALTLSLSSAAVGARPWDGPATITPGNDGVPMQHVWEPWRGGIVFFYVEGVKPQDANRSVFIDVQCYNGPYGWWDTHLANTPSFILGSQPTTAPPDLGSVIYVQWPPNAPVQMDCTARLFKVHKQKGVTVLDTYSFTTR